MCQTGFLANKLDQQSINDISKFSVRVFAQVVATGHMQGDAIVSSDYAIKVVNILYYHDEQAAINEIIWINFFTGKVCRKSFFIFKQSIHMFGG
ncbi:putative immunity protein [Ruoffia sp. FAM 26255]|uniref:putative immunity protein n=1 Tax=Ruoffia sp. FAM 26255 TaxID=3259519 RepID=UPI003888B561